jgi:hypothetical protein
MAKTIRELSQAQERLRVKAQQLSLKVKMQEDRQKHSDLVKQLKTMGGRIR